MSLCHPQPTTSKQDILENNTMKKPSKAKPVVPARDPLLTAKFAYFSICCNEVAKKTPLVAANRAIGTYLGAKPEAEGTLGSWRCSKCGKPAKVTRHVRKEEVAA
jgi:hypothetical protein